MTDFLTLPLLFIKTIGLRPYVFVFLMVFLFASITKMGKIRTLVFLLGTWFIAFGSEFSSTRTGFPYGWYQYTQTTRGQELFIFNVPFMDSLSYTFLLFASYSLSLFFLSPLRRKGWNVVVVDSFAIRGSFRHLLLTSIFMMMIDFVIDPTTLKGDQWFLGQIYHYEYEGYYFGVPLSNALGWGLVALVATSFYQWVERKFLGKSFRDQGLRLLPFQGLYGVGLYLGVLFFILFVTAWIQEWGLLIAGCFIFLIPIVLLVFRFFDPRVQASDQEWQEHLKEFQGYVERD